MFYLPTEGPKLLQEPMYLPENQLGNVDTGWCQATQPDL